MSVNSCRPRAAAYPFLAALLPVAAVVFIAYLVIGIAMPVLPLHVHGSLGLGTFMVGLVAGSQFGSSLIPLGTLLLVAPLRSIAPPPHARALFTSIIAIVWVPGLGLALSGVGFGAMTTFTVLLFAQHGWGQAQHGWGQAWLAFTALSVAFMAGRLIFGHLPARPGPTCMRCFSSARWSCCARRLSQCGS